MTEAADVTTTRGDASAPRSDMTPDRWERLEALCERALEHPAGEARIRAVREACDDERLAAEALELADAADRAGDFLQRPLLHGDALADGMLAIVGTDTEDRASPSLTASPDGPFARTVRDDPRTTPPPAPALPAAYRVVRALGRGATADVFLATRDVAGAGQDVAVKVLRAGHDSLGTVRRFRRERRILASLSHPNIARLLDAGVTGDGRPFVAMEFVDGEPITTWCDRQRLDVDARVRLFLRVCSAVQHAHQHFVVHRDLKPSNLFVSHDGVPKLLDFGIGKVLDGTTGDSAEDTTFGVRLLTPRYAAPEQLAGEPVTAATDVYALGVLLYELLTGRLPWDDGARDAESLLAARRGRPVPRASERVRQTATNDPTSSALTDRGTSGVALRRRLAGDLDVILLTALRPEPARRYPTAAAFADDLRRHLDGHPVRARNDTIGYRARKFVVRHPTGVVAAAACALALVGTTAFSVSQARRSDAAAARVLRERDRAREVRGFLLETFGASDASRAGADSASIGGLLDRQTALVDTRYATRPVLRADMLEALAEAYDRLGRPRDAEPLAARAVALRRAVADTTVAGPDALAASLSLHGWLLHVTGRSGQAVPVLKESVVRWRALPHDAAGRSRALNDLGVVYNASAHYDSAIVVLHEALALRDSLFGPDDRAVGITANNLAAAHFFRAEYDSASVVQQRALRALNASLGADHQRTIIALSNLATFRRQAGDFGGAEASFRELLGRQSRLQGRAHPVTARVMLALAQMRMDAARRATGSGGDGDVVAASLLEADTLLREAISALRGALGPSHPDVARARAQWAAVRHALGDDETARREFDAAVPLLVSTLGAEHPATLAARRDRAVLDADR